MNHNEVVINIDDLLVADTFIADIDEAKNHYDVRAEYSRLLGMALAKQFDLQTMRVGLLAARSSATVSGGNGRTAITSANARTSGADLAAVVFDAAQAMDEKMFLSLSVWHWLSQNSIITWCKQRTSLTVIGVALVFMLMVLFYVLQNTDCQNQRSPTSNISAASGENNTCNGDFSSCCCSSMGRNKRLVQ